MVAQAAGDPAKGMGLPKAKLPRQPSAARLKRRASQGVKPLLSTPCADPRKAAASVAQGPLRTSPARRLGAERSGLPGIKNLVSTQLGRRQMVQGGKRQNLSAPGFLYYTDN